MDIRRLPESRIGVPSADCGQDAGYWHSVAEIATECEVSELIAGLVVGLQPNICVETGCYHGQTTELIGRALLNNNHGHLISLDTDVECVQIARGRCVGLPVTVIQEDARRWTPLSLIDFAFVDSGNPADRLGDLDQLLPQLHPRCLVVIHDTGTQHALRAPLIEWVGRKGWQLLLLPTPRGLGLLRPPAGLPIVV